MSVLIDQAARDRFILERGKNISVIAPAGVGKTRSMINRIVNLARQPDAEEILPRLIVVTYSVRAAQQMQQKARVAIREAKVSARVQRAFQQTFFGTIHSYCVRLLERFGHYLGLPSSVGLLQEDEELWNRFLLKGLGNAGGANPNLADLFHFYSPEKLYALGREIAPGPVQEIGPAPTLNLQRLLDYRDDSLHSATKKSISTAQGKAKQWSEAWARGERFRPLPECPKSEKAAAFAGIWTETFAPLHEWLRDGALAFGRRVAKDYEAFRWSEAVMTYDDQVRMALRVLEHPAVQRELAAEHLSVLLDEAQDTDPQQFQVLLRVAGLPAISEQSRDQSFCMVGDFQQAIYAPRSDMAVYRRVHDEISAEPRGTSSRLEVTFRCDRAVIDFVNRMFPAVLNNIDGQCEFIRLSPRDDAGPGQVTRWTCPDLQLPVDVNITAEMRSRHEARFLAERIRELGASGLGAIGWSQVAILCPRKGWLLDIQRELVELGLPVQLHSSNERQGDRTPGTWLTALVWIAAHPEDSFEIAGVLREVFGVSDHDMAVFTGGEGDRLRLDLPALSAQSRPGRSRALQGGSTQEIEFALNILREACAEATRVPLHRAVHELMERTRLRERLNSIPDLKLENVERELDDLLALIAERSASGATLAEVAEELRLGLGQVYPAEEEVQDAIQLLTSHKSKGLEWETVIVPYFFRAIESKSAPYPRLVQGRDGRELICRDKSDFNALAAGFVALRERQQLQRLLYVMCTRAKGSLLMIDDETLFAGQKRLGGWSAGELLDMADESQREIWENLPETVIPIEAGSVIAAESKPTMISFPEISEADLRASARRAGEITRRVTPHALAVHAPVEAEPEMEQEREEEVAATDNPGIRYGTWWHEFVQTIPWSATKDRWQAKFEEALPGSPQRERFRREWELFGGSSLATWLNQSGRLVQVEFPFLWREDGGPCVEGVMDLAVYNEEDSTWRVIDWKTNRVDSRGAAELVDVYRGQIRAYVKALRAMLSCEVRGSLYLTQTGEWIEIDGL